jgi:pimeloyl-ACP methyl ester carboxylesterase
MLFCLVHGAWHDDTCWQPLAAELARRGHESLAPVLPLDDDRASFDDYAQVVVESLREREPAVLVGHSMSSAVIPLVAIRRPVRGSSICARRWAALCPRQTSRHGAVPTMTPRRRMPAAAAGGYAIARSTSSTHASIEMPGGHFPMLEHPELLADVLSVRPSAVSLGSARAG